MAIASLSFAAFENHFELQRHNGTESPRLRVWDFGLFPYGTQDRLGSQKPIVEYGAMV